VRLLAQLHSHSFLPIVTPACLVSVRNAYRGTSLMRKHTPLGPYRRPVPRVLGGSLGGGCFLMSEVPLHNFILTASCRSSRRPASRCQRQ
jgi:hypothetical protein